MYPVALPYIHTQDRGQELRYMLRSLKNLNGFSGEVLILGDKESWFNGINHIQVRRMSGKPYLDQVMKMKIACEHMPEKFIAMQDDIYICEPVEPTVYYLGNLTDDVSTLHKRTKKATKYKLLEMGLTIRDYEAHAPMLVEKDKLADTLEVVIKNKTPIQWRSVYGNMWDVKAELFEDQKTKTKELKQGKIISTNFYTDELNKLFPVASEYEIM